MELVSALAQLATLAIELTRLGEAAQREALSHAVLEERTRIAGDIHDNLAQSFTSIAMQSESLLSAIDDESPFRRTLERIERTARLGLAEARSSVVALRPVRDGVGDLETALDQLAERCNIEGTVTCEFRARTEACVLSPDVREAVLRVSQEAVSNALRHSGGSSITIAFEVHEGRARLAVTDDGVGPPDLVSAARAGFGIEGMRARASALGGTLHLTGGPHGRGTRVEMAVACDATVRA